MALRLAVLFTVASSLVLAGVTTFLYREVAAHLTEEHTHLVSGFVRMIQREPPEWSRIGADHRRPADRTAATLQLEPFEVRLLGDGGEVLFQTPGMERVPASAFASLAENGEGRPEVMPSPWRNPKGEEFLVASVRLVHRDGAVRVVQVALDNGRDAHLLTDVRRTGSVLLALGIVVSALAAALVTRIGLRPVGRLADEVARITTADLRGGLPAGDWPRELVSLAAALDEMLRRLDDAFSGLSRFSANLAHEVRTPLNNLRGEAEVALSKARSPEEYREVLESSLEEYQRLTSMIEALLFLARAEGREVQAARTRVDLAEESRRVRELYLPLAEEQEVEIVVRGSAELEVTVELFRRALANLLDNALRFTPAGGRIEVEVAGLPDGGAEVRVRDSGRGIPAEDLPRVFERFYRGRSNSRPGSGLGLAIVESIVRLHGGRVEASSEAGNGTTVTLRFPGSSPKG